MLQSWPQQTKVGCNAAELAAKFTAAHQSLPQRRRGGRKPTRVGRNAAKMAAKLAAAHRNWLQRCRAGRKVGHRTPMLASTPQKLAASLPKLVATPQRWPQSCPQHTKAGCNAAELAEELATTHQSWPERRKVGRKPAKVGCNAVMLAMGLSRLAAAPQNWPQGWPRTCQNWPQRRIAGCKPTASLPQAC